jgi:HNH endonuclease
MPGRRGSSGLPVQWSTAEFMKRCRISAAGCWEWQWGKNRRGYGKVVVHYKNVAAHRLSWTVHRGQIPDGMLVCHRCDNPPCCNPDHLFLGTNADNMRDAYDKGRSVRGERVHTVRLTEAQVLTIAQRIKDGETSADLAREFGVAHGTIWFIEKKRSWKYLWAEAAS